MTREFPEILVLCSLSHCLTMIPIVADEMLNTRLVSHRVERKTIAPGLEPLISESAISTAAFKTEFGRRLIVGARSRVSASASRSRSLLLASISYCMWQDGGGGVAVSQTKAEVK